MGVMALMSLVQNATGLTVESGAGQGGCCSQDHRHSAPSFLLDRTLGSTVMRGLWAFPLVYPHLIVSLVVALVCCIPCCISLLGLAGSWLRRRQRNEKPLPPGTMGLPIIGETLSFLFWPAEYFDKRHRLYGQVYKTHLLGKPTVRVMGAENVRKVMMAENTLVTSYWPSTFRRLLGVNNITMSSGERHRVLRRGVIRAFSHEALRSYTPEMQQQVRVALQSWCREDKVVAFQECRKLTFSVVCRALLGLRHMEGQHRDELLEVFETFIKNLFSAPIEVPGFGLYKGLKARRILLRTIEEWIQEKEERQQAEVTPSGTDALQLLVAQLQSYQEEDQLTREELKEVCLDLMFAGHATISSAATSLVYLLNRNPRVIKRILDELEEHGLRESQAGDLSYDALSNLTYVGHVVKEALRMYPPAGGAFRKVLKTFDLGDYQIPEGWMISLGFRETQAYSELFTEAEQFNPERWEQPLPAGEEAFNFLPFGRGARGCVGKEYAKLLLRLFTVELCRNCHWRLLNEDVKMLLLPVPAPADGLPMAVTALQPHFD
ncbi:cytochrome P450 26A1-like [Babylonia areolata]|uniref:cytochrome P450 26A1-like n=1 Tax=Babylonia areolata TaxID=304850 RepID=UPI003FD6B93F